MVERRWKRRKDDRSGEILEAALVCFSKKGFAATRMEDIARRAKIAKGTVYLYFDSKEAVFKALARGSMGARLEAIQTFIAQYQGGAADLLRLVITNLGEFARTSDRVILPRLLLAEAGNFPELVKFWRQELLDRGLGILQTIIRRGIESGEFRDLPAEHLARLCVAPMITIVIWRTTFAQFDKEPYDYQGLVAAHLQILLHGLCAGSDT
ncbi:MAG TPA: TetR/AcrR family transcriptional regulator [Rhizomicrobium sp.]|nr:TetR/AcrR family transcriptional regulator [Rhizomicrobium sp.]